MSTVHPTEEVRNAPASSASSLPEIDLEQCWRRSSPGHFLTRDGRIAFITRRLTENGEVFFDGTIDGEAIACWNRKGESRAYDSSVYPIRANSEWDLQWPL